MSAESYGESRARITTRRISRHCVHVWSALGASGMRSARRSCRLVGGTPSIECDRALRQVVARARHANLRVSVVLEPSPSPSSELSPGRRRRPPRLVRGLVEPRSPRRRRKRRLRVGQMDPVGSTAARTPGPPAALAANLSSTGGVCWKSTWIQTGFQVKHADCRRIVEEGDAYGSDLPCLRCPTTELGVDVRDIEEAALPGPRVGRAVDLATRR